jgi:hypothetical protein
MATHVELRCVSFDPYLNLLSQDAKGLKKICILPSRLPPVEVPDLSDVEAILEHPYDF